MRLTRLRRFALLASLLVASALSGPRVDAQDGSPPSPAPGRLVDVGGWRLHLNCTGRATPSQPTVILEAGIGDFSVEWSLVQPGVAELTRVCSYDRAGDGWSDVGPHPRTMRQIVTRGLPDETGPDAKRVEEDHQKEQAAVARLSRNGRQIIATRSGHHIQLDEPDLVVQSIAEVVKAVRR